MPQYLSPVCNDQTIDANGDPLVGGQIETYIAMSSTPAATYTDDSGSTPHSNPIILDSLGYPSQGSIWLTGGIAYKFIIKNAAGVTLRTIDEIAGINDATLSQSEWLESGFTPTYINGTTFSVPGDQTGTLQINRRVRTQNTSGFIYSTISNSVFAAGITTVTLTNDSGTLDAGLSAVAYALLSASPLSVPNLPSSKITGPAISSGMTMDRGVLARLTVGNGPIENPTFTQFQTGLPINQPRIDVASASTVNLTTSAPNNDQINITGTTTINGFTVTAGRQLTVRFASALTLTNSASLVTQRGVNITTAAGDTCTLQATAANTVEIIGYTRALQAVGTAQTWQNLSASRAVNTDYNNTTGQAISVSVNFTATTGQIGALRVAGLDVSRMQGGDAGGTVCQVTAIVPPGAIYSFRDLASTTTGQIWFELR